MPGRSDVFRWISAGARFTIVDRGDQRATISIQHEQLPTFDDDELWKFYWAEWLDAVELARDDDADGSGHVEVVTR